MAKAQVRKLTFADTDEAREDFALLYQGFVTGGSGGGERKTMETTRREAKLLDKLEEVSEEFGGASSVCDTCGQRINVKRVTKSGPQEIVIDQPEYEMLKKYFEATPWTVRISRRVVNISDWLASIQPEGS